MSYSNTERYATARHEAIHCLAAVHFGIGVARVDVIAGESSWCTGGFSTLRLPCEAHELPRLLRTDRARAVQIATGLITACSAPSVDEKNAINASDQAPIDEFKKYWSCATPPWQSLYGDALQQVRAWLRQRGTELAIQRFSQALFSEGRLDGERLQLALARSIDPSAPPLTTQPRPRASATQPKMSARAMLNEAVLKYYDYTLNPGKSLYCTLFVPSHEDLAREEGSLDAS